jgi:hypothetical protein
VLFRRTSGANHVPTALGAFPEDLGADLAVVGVVALALLGTLFTGTGAGLGELRAVV